MFLVIDGTNLIHRMYHAMPLLSTKSGRPTNAVKGVANKLIQLIRVYTPSHVIFAFDTQAPYTMFNVKAKGCLGPMHREEDAPCRDCGWGYGLRRKWRYEAYKENRPPKDEALLQQYEDCRAVVETFGCHWVESRGWEADDVVATAVVHSAAAGLDALVVTSDKDAYQLLRHRGVNILRLGASTSTNPQPDKIVTREDAEQKMGFSIDLMPTYQALCGDPTDNLPGVKGIGAESARTLVQVLGDLHSIYKALAKKSLWDEALPPDKYKRQHIWKRLLFEERETAFLMHELCTLDSLVPHVPRLDKLRRIAKPTAEIRALWSRLEFTGLDQDTECAIAAIGGGLFG